MLIGTVGYQILGNHSIGPVLLPQIRELSWPDFVEIEELNWSPIAVVQAFEDRKNLFDRVILLSAIERPGRRIGDINIFKWKGNLPSETQIQACMGDAATGVISVENLLVIGEYFNIWGRDVFLIDVEPGKEIAGVQLTKKMQAIIPKILRLLQQLIEIDVKSNHKIESLYGDTMFLRNHDFKCQPRI